MQNKNSKLLFTLAFTTAFTFTGLFAGVNPAYAASLTEAEKVEFENSYFNNSVVNKASKMLLKDAPATTANIKDSLNQKIDESDALLAESKDVIESIRPERANESKTIKDLNQSVFDNQVYQEAIFMLFDLTPKTVESIKGSLTELLNSSIPENNEATNLLYSMRGLKQISIIHYNDTHGRVEENAKNGEIGYAKIKTFYDYKNVNNNTLLLDAGDTLHGTIFANIAQGQSVVEAVNKMGLTAMTAGNHDFNYGYKRLLELKDLANYPILGSNVVDESGNQILDVSQIVEINGVKVGIFGLSTPETKTKSSPVNTEGLTFEDPVEVAKKEVENLKANGADIVVCLTHLGIDEESEDTSTKVADNVDGIDLIIDGHSHSQLDEGKIEKTTLIAQTGAHGYNLGEVTLLVDKDNKVNAKFAKLHPYKKMQHINANQEILDVINKYSEANKDVLSQKVGMTDVDLDGVRGNVRTKETNLGDFIADAMKESIGADITITNGGGIRDSIVKGDITKGDVLTVFPFTNFLVKIEITGADILAALEHGLTDTPNEAGKFPQIAGMTVKYDSSKEAGSKVTEVLVNGEALDPNKTYSLATNDFMAIGGDGYEMFKGKTRSEERGLISDIFEEAIKANGTINPSTDGRMTDISK